MSEITYKQAITRAIGDALAADEDVFLLGEDVGAAGGAFKATDGLFEHIADALARHPQRCDWRIALLRIGRRR